MKDLLRGHEKYRRRAFSGERDFLRLLASEGQSPDALFVGCSDSRVVPELLTSSSPGTLFVVRNVANIVPELSHADASVGAAIEYAVGHLEVRHAIVCGHTRCGGVKAAMDGVSLLTKTPSLREWLHEAIDPAIARVQARTGPILTEPQEWRAVVEENVVTQLSNLLTFPCVAQAVEAGTLELHGWVYDIDHLELHVWDDDAGRFTSAKAIVGK